MELQCSLRSVQNDKRQHERAMTNRETDPAFIDFHDATVMSITLHGDASAILTFGSINLFYASGPDEYDVWECSASIACYEVRRLKVIGTLDSHSWVSDGSMMNAEEQVASLTADESPVLSMSLSLMSGTDVQLSMAAAKIVDVNRVKYLEKWTGPLVSTKE
jgi:hypothetical protein